MKIPIFHFRMSLSEKKAVLKIAFGNCSTSIKNSILLSSNQLGANSKVQIKDCFRTRSESSENPFSVSSSLSDTIFKVQINDLSISLLIVKYLKRISYQHNSVGKFLNN